MKQEMTYERALEELEGIVTKVESGHLEIASLTSNIKRAQELLAFCKTQLSQVEADVTNLLNNDGKE